MQKQKSNIMSDLDTATDKLMEQEEKIKKANMTAIELLN